MHPLRRFIKKEKLTIREFIDKYNIGLSRSFVTMVCCGTANLAKGTAERISKATGIPAAMLMFPELDKKYKKEQGKTKGSSVCKSLQSQ